VTKDGLSLHRPDDWPEVLSVSQVAELFSVGAAAVRAGIRRGELSAVAIGGQYRIAAESLWPLVPSEIRAQWPDGRWNKQDSKPEDA